MKFKFSSARHSLGENIFMIFNYGFLIFIAVATAYPMWHVIMGSFSENYLIMQHTGLLFTPRGFSTASYSVVFRNPMIIRGYMNTLFLLGVGVSLSLFMTSLCAYFLSRNNVYFKKPVMLMVTITMFFSGGMIPAYLNLMDLGLLGNHWGLIFPGMINVFNMIIMRTSFNTIPEYLSEAAYIDGAGHMQILFKIILPLSKAVIAVMILYYGLSIWNAWFWASVIRLPRELLPLQVILRELLIQNQSIELMDYEGVSETIKYATIIVATVPILTIYPFLQKYFARGVLIGGVKG